MPDEQLEAECRTFTRYLVNQQANDYLLSQYGFFHRAIKGSADPFDRFVLRFAVRGPACTRIADAYLSSFRKHSILRSKLVLLLGLIEVSPPYYRRIEEPDSSAFLQLTKMAFGYAAALAAGLVLLAPVHLVKSIGGSAQGAETD